ncbi:membrane dipeptidase [candidate division KSB1 bacterium]|nr:membrane dipeptidase [candidate division KSB1 bacterium]
MCHTASQRRSTDKGVAAVCIELKGRGLQITRNTRIICSSQHYRNRIQHCPCGITSETELTAKPVALAWCSIDLIKNKGGAGLADVQDVSQFPRITLELVRRGYSDEDIRKIWGENFLRVFKEVEHYAEKMVHSDK